MRAKKPGLRLKITKPRKERDQSQDLAVQCLICDTPFKVKYLFNRKKYSDKNNWGYWTKKESDKQKYFCDNCLWKLHYGSMTDWIDKNQAKIFYTYIRGKQIRKRNNSNSKK